MTILVPWLVDKHLMKVMTFLQQMLDSQTVNRLLAPVALAWLPPWNWPWIPKKLKYMASIYIISMLHFHTDTVSKPYFWWFKGWNFRVSALFVSFAHSFPIVSWFVSQHLPVVHWSIFRRSPFRNRAGLELGNGTEMMLHVLILVQLHLTWG